MGVLAAIAIPRYVDLRSSAANAAARGNLAAVKSAFAIYIAENKAYPTATQLLGNLTGTGSAPLTVAGTGYQFTIGGTLYDVTLFKNEDCTGAVTAGSDTVKCVQDVTSGGVSVP